MTDAIVVSLRHRMLGILVCSGAENNAYQLLAMKYTSYTWTSAAGWATPRVETSGRLRYSPPEAVADLSLLPHPPQLTTVTSAADIWSIGVIAFELLTHERVFSPDATDEEVIWTLHGHRLPWETAVQGHAERCQKLRGLKSAVLACLSRDASRRPTAAALLASFGRMFDSMKTQGTFASSKLARDRSHTW
jgi:serine/threonine protein kinase